MGHKKRSSKQQPSSSAAATASAPSVSAAEADSPIEPRNDTVDVSVVKQECERALNALRRGNHTRALKVMKDACSKFESSALIHRVQGTVCVKVASVIDDGNVKQRHLKNAIESARRAVELSPNSIEFVHFYANLMYEVASEGKEYEEVVKECERALRIDSPVDPAKESLQEESQQKISSPQERIRHVQEELQALIQKSNIASLSTWMKSFGNTDEKIRLIPLRRVAEDPMEVALAQGRRTNEIKRATKTPEERRKEIEVRVAAARLLQQKTESGQLPNGGEKGIEGSSGSGQQRPGERRRNSRKTGTNAERRGWVRNYWNSMSIDKKKELLTIRVSDLKAHFGSSKDGLPNEILSEALSWAEANKTWKFWACCKCGEKFVDSDSHMQHVVQEHMGNLMPKMQAVLPSGVGNEWVEMLLSCSWKPLNITAAVKLLKGQLKSHDSDGGEDFYSTNNTEEVFEDCFKDAWDSSPDNGNTEEYSGSVIGGSNHEEIKSIQCRECDGNIESFSYSFADNWPMSDDAERGKLLKKIHTMFEMLIRHKYLSESHLKKVMEFAVNELQGISSGSQLLNHGVDRTPVCICFLEAPQLRNILKFLQDISHSCGLGRYTEKSSSTLEDANSSAQGPEIKERVVLNGDASYVILDEQLLSTESTQSSADKASKDNAAPISESESLLSWIFAGLTSDEQLTSWNNLKEDKTRQGMEILQLLEKEFFHLQNLCERKCEHLSYKEALQAVEDLCLAEDKKRDGFTDFAHQSLESVLRKRREELIESENDVMSTSYRFELDAVSFVLEEVEALNVNRFGYEETYGGVTSQLCDLESGEGGDWKTKDYWHQFDTCIKDAIQRKKEQLSIELSKIDARLMRNVNGMQQLELKIEPVSAFDYRLILLPLVKSYMRAHLEYLAEKDATEKSDAAREAFLAELALDSKKGGKGGADNSKHAHEKPKDKKKNKESKKAKDSKATSGTAQDSGFLLGNAELDSSTAASDEDHVEPENIASASNDDSRQEDEELRRKIELEEEERKLEEMLEYQRRLENEAKQKLLADQQKKVSEACFEKGAMVQECKLDQKSGNQDDLHQLKPRMQEQLVQENGAVSLNTINGAPALTKSSAVCGVQRSSIHQDTPTEVEQNGGHPADGSWSFDRRTGRKNRRQRNVARLPDGKWHTISPEKDTKDVTNTTKNNHVKELVGSGDSLHNGSSSWGENGTQSLRQLQVEDDDEERFQADLKKAVRQSLDTFQARKKVPLVPDSRLQQNVSLETDDSGIAANEIALENTNDVDVVGPGLRNEVGEYNCFLNVIIQSLWHLRQFRDEFLRRSTSQHIHVGEPCVVCALHDIFTALSLSSTETRREAVAPTPLRVALSNLYPDSNFFQVSQMNDASEVLGVIFQCLHRAYTCPSVPSAESTESNRYGAWDCVNSACIVHSLFGMDIFERMNCYNCHLESRHLKYTSFFHNINASALRTMKVMCPESSFDELLNFVEMNHQLTCDPEVGGCGKLNYIHHILAKSPRVFTTVLGWQNTCESAEDIKATLAALSPKIDVSVLYRGLDPGDTHNLISVVCYYGQHYHCFAYSNDRDRWIMYDDKTVKVIGGWDDVLSMCERGHLQPQVLFFEAES